MSALLTGLIQIVLFITAAITLEYLLWKLISKGTGYRQFIWIFYLMLLLSTILVLVPLELICYAVFIAGKNLVLGERSFPYEIFYPREVHIAILIAAAIWCIGFLSVYSSSGKVYGHFRQSIREGIPVSGSLQTIFQKECLLLKPSDQPIIQLNKYVKSPRVIHWKKQDVIQFPLDEIDSESFRMICRHELLHVRHRDYLWRKIVRIVVCISWFNPMVWLLAKELDFWMDVCRDAEVIDSGIVSAEEYYLKIAEYMNGNNGKTDFTSLSFAAANNQNQLLRRRDIVMRLNHRRRFLTNFGTGIILSAFVIGSAVTAYAGIDIMQYGTLKMYETVVNEENKVYEPNIEYTEDTTEFVTEYMSLNPLTRAEVLHWTVLRHNRLESVAFHIEAGQILRLAGFADPSDVNFKFGYTDHNTDHYCIANDSFAYSFTVEETGDYHIFFRNLSATKNLNVTIMFEIQ